jgi:hypothetical protein
MAMQDRPVPCGKGTDEAFSGRDIIVGVPQMTEVVESAAKSHARSLTEDKQKRPELVASSKKAHCWYE